MSHYIYIDGSRNTDKTPMTTAASGRTKNCQHYREGRKNSSVKKRKKEEYTFSIRLLRFRTRLNFEERRLCVVLRTTN